MTPRSVRFWLGAVLVIALGALVILTGVWTVRENEQGVVTRFGRVSRVLTPGIQFTLPWPIERLTTVGTREVRDITVGYRAEADDDESVTRNEAEWLTGNTNIVDVKVVVQYRIDDPVEYLFRHGRDQADYLIRKCVESVLTESIASIGVDDLLGTGRNRVRQLVLQRGRELMENYETGIFVESANFEKLSAPDRVKHAFDDVQSAGKDAEGRLDSARLFQATVMNQAEADAKKIVSDAESYKLEVVGEAKGQKELFEKILEEYRRAPEATRERLVLEAQKKVLASGTRRVVVDPNNPIRIQRVR